VELGGSCSHDAAILHLTFADHVHRLNAGQDRITSSGECSRFNTFAIPGGNLLPVMAIVVISNSIAQFDMTALARQSPRDHLNGYRRSLRAIRYCDTSGYIATKRWVEPLG
jgi:hypothetical protein